jgi:hypothetical protein
MRIKAFALSSFVALFSVVSHAEQIENSGDKPERLIAKASHTCGERRYVLEGESLTSDDELAIRDIISFLFQGANILLQYPAAPEPSRQRYSLQKAEVEEIIKANHQKGSKTGGDFHQPAVPSIKQSTPQNIDNSFIPHIPLPNISPIQGANNSEAPKKRKRTRSRRKKREGASPETFLASQVIQPQAPRDGSLRNDDTISLR